MSIDLQTPPTYDIEPRVRKIWEEQKVDEFDTGLFRYYSDTLLRAFNEGTRGDGLSDIEYGYTPDGYKTACEINIFRFSAAKTLAEAQELNAAFRAAKDFPDFLERARVISGKFNEKWLRTEYDSAYMVAENAAAFWRLRGQTGIFKFWQYVTVDDDKVRPEHERLHGIILGATDSRWEKIYPPNGWKCRCRVTPKVSATKAQLLDGEKKADAFMDSAVFAKAEAQGWGVNRALTGEVFTTNQFYINKLPHNAASKIEGMTWAKWGLDSISKEMGRAEANVPVDNRRAEEIWKQESVGDALAIKLHDGRLATMDKQSFDIHTAKKGSDDRSWLFTSMKETAVSPDEIWINKYTSGFNNVKLIKFYKDGTIVLTYSIEKRELILKTWYQLHLDKKTINTNRSGLLVKKKGKA